MGRVGWRGSRWRWSAATYSGTGGSATNRCWIPTVVATEGAPFGSKMNMLTAKDNTGTTTSKKKTTQGRRKIEIKKIENLGNRQVTFSKRRVGMFKKASELCILSGAEVAIIVHSLGKRVFAFGHPKDTSEPGSGGGEVRENCASIAKAREFNKHYLDMCNELEAEKKRKEVIEEKQKKAEEQRKAAGGGYGYNAGVGYWWDEPVDSMDVEELEEYMAALGELINKVTMKANDLMHAQSSNSLPALPLQPLPVAAFGGFTNFDVEGCSTFGEIAAILNQNPGSGSFDYGSSSNCILPNFGDLGQI